MLYRLLLLGLSLACGIAAVPAGKRILGYRTVDEAEADKINAAGAPVFDEDRYYGGGKQLGAGVYTSPYAGAWPQIKGKWVCVIYIDSKAFDNTPKVWIPAENPLTKVWLWYTEGNEIKDYLNTYPNDWDTDKILLLSWLQDLKGETQLLILPQLVKSEGGLGLEAVCKLKIDDLPDKERINYDDWVTYDNRGDQVDWKGDPL